MKVTKDNIGFIQGQARLLEFVNKYAMNHQQKIDQFAKLAAYILGRHPDEFGIVLDQKGFVKIKEFLKAVHELDGWKHIRANHINELILVSKKPTVEIQFELIRAVNREHLPQSVYQDSPPKLLYICIKQKSYPVISEHGILPSVYPCVICAADQGMAEKIGKRRDHQPVMLTIQTQTARDKGIRFYRYGNLIYLADSIPPDCFTGPPLPKETHKEKHEETIDKHRKQTAAGSFMWSPDQEKNKKKEVNWKKDKKRLRREKQKFWPD